MRILVLGSGAREHAIITALLAEQAGHVITAAPGNAGIAADVETVSLDPTNGALVAEYAIENGVELVVVGPEAPLIAGVNRRGRLALSETCRSHTTRSASFILCSRLFALYVIENFLCDSETCNASWHATIACCL